MQRTRPFLAQELGKFFEAVWLDLPAEACKVLLGVGCEEELRQAGWKAYDSWINLANEITNAVYSDPIVGDITGLMMESALRLRQVGGAVAMAFFSNLWPAIGLPTRSEMVAMRDELRALREELAIYASEMPVAADFPRPDTQRAPRETLKAAQFNRYRVANGNGSAAHQGKSYVIV
jgi:hypothetical protein